MTDDAGALGNLLCTCRRRAGLSQEELAERSGLSARAIGNLERGSARWPHPDSARRLADALGLRGQARVQFFATAGRQPAHDAYVVPRQLPFPVAQFAGRQGELAALTSLLDRAGTAPAAVIAAIGGPPGVGKTALAVHWAHKVADRFPDGQLYLNLRGFGPSGRPVPPAEALRGLLDALQVPARQVPAGLDAQAGLYRSLMSGRRMLVLLDNARDAAQIRPLLPGGPGCLALVTSRSQLSGLVAAEGARTLNLCPMTEPEARELLAGRLGATRLAAEPGAAAALIGSCARLPLALALAAARALACPGLRLAALAGELHDALGRLDALETGDADAGLRAVFSWSLDGLPADATRMFALLGLHAGPDITIPAAASLAGLPLPPARLALRELAEAHLITEHATGRYSLHDLLRAYAAERAAAAFDPAARRDARSRILDHYTRTAVAAALLLNPERDPIAPAPPRPGVTPEHPGGYQQAQAWFTAEHQVLLAAAALAADAGWDACAWQLPWAMADYLDRSGHWHQWAAIQRAALAAAARLGDTAGHAVTSRLLASSCTRLGDYDQARAHLTECLELYRELGDRGGQAHAHRSLGCVAADQGRHADALRHDEQSLALYQATGNRAGQATALANVGYSHNQVGNYQQARTSCRQAIGLHRRTGDRAGLAHAWAVLGDAEHNLGNLTEAARCCRRALAIFRDLGDRPSQAYALADLGGTCHAAGQLSNARDAWQQALDIFTELHHPQADQVRARLRQLGEVPEPAPSASVRV
jgi:tetratricopeptide (TPR) repeat protein/transcriptional regulator with XRE-family HTH domain